MLGYSVDRFPDRTGNQAFILKRHPGNPKSYMSADQPMEQSLFFPHFYLANDTLFRHAFLHTNSMIRVHPCDRPGRDSKPVKQFLRALQYTEDYMPTEFNEDTSLRTCHAVKQAYESKNTTYIDIIGKHEKQRTSAKTFHLCRVKVWPDVSRTMVDLSLAKNDDYDEWCFGTRRMVMIFTTNHTLDRQRSLTIPRCTDDVEFDELAQLLECLPLGNESDTTITRGAFEFPYVVPKTISEMDVETLQSFGKSFRSQASGLFPLVNQAVKSLEPCTDPHSLNQAFGEIQKAFQEFRSAQEQVIKSKGLKPETRYAQYRWYVSAGTPLDSLAISEPEGSKGFSLTTHKLPISASNQQSVRCYPGCYVWAIEKPRIGAGGFLQRLFG